MDADKRIRAYAKQVGRTDLTAKQKRRIRQKGRRDEEGRRQQAHFNK